LKGLHILSKSLYGAVENSEKLTIICCTEQPKVLLKSDIQQTPNEGKRQQQ
jgi:hypothetical protein